MTPPPRMPRPLRRFAELLALFDDDVSVPLGELSRRLAALIGPLRAPSALGDGDPEGYAGLARRGPYERLLLSEWLLADELPDEFLRRAAVGEHAFLQLERAAEQGNRRSVVLFDAGPSMLGGPRIVQLAVLVLMATRAAAARADFAFGLLQRPGPGADGDARRLYEEVDASSMAAFLSGRGLHEPTLDDVGEWLERLGPLERDDDLWVVSGPRLCGEVDGLSHLVLDEQVALEAPKVTVALADRLGHLGRSLALELPGPEVRRQLLIRPLRVARAAKTTPEAPELDVAGGVVFSPSGRRLLARRHDGRLISMGVPRVPTRRARFTDVWPRGADRDLVPVAVGWRRRQAIVVRMGEDRLIIEGSFGTRERPVRHHALTLPPVVAEVDRADRLGVAFYCHGAQPLLLFEICRTDGASTLFGALVDEPDTCLIRPLSYDDMLAFVGGEPLAAGVFLGRSGRPVVREWGFGGEMAASHVPAHHGEVRAAVIGRSRERWRDWPVFLEGGHVDPAAPRTFQSNVRTVDVAAGGRLVGVLSGARAEDAAPVVYDAAQQRLEVLGGPHAGALTLDEEWGPAGPVVVSPVDPLVAWLTPQRVVVVDLSAEGRGLRHLVEC